MKVNGSRIKGLATELSFGETEVNMLENGWMTGSEDMELLPTQKMISSRGKGLSVTGTKAAAVSAEQEFSFGRMERKNWRMITLNLADMGSLNVLIKATEVFMNFILDGKMEEGHYTKNL
jgi:hypothetical protein